MNREKPTLYLTEARACVLLCIILGGTVLAHFAYKHMLQRRPVPQHILEFMCIEAGSLETEQTAFEEKKARYTHYSDKRRPNKPYARENRPAYARTTDANARRRPSVTCSPFDPNTIHGDSLRRWGVRDYVVDNLINYRESGGSFRSPADLAKIYGLDSTTLRVLTRCMRIASATAPAAVVSLDINTATVEDMQKLNGIGPVFAERIVKFREALGGFTSIDQIAETYGLPPETFDMIRSRLKAEGGYKRIPLNTATQDQLAQHPYISQREAAAIANYIANHGDVLSPDDLLGLHIVDREWLQRVAPYFDFGARAPAAATQE